MPPGITTENYTDKWNRARVRRIASSDDTVNGEINDVVTVVNSAGIEAPLGSAADPQYVTAGRVKGFTVAPPVTAGAYAAGEVVGGKLTFTAVMGALFSGVIQSIRVNAKTVQSTGLKLYLFRDDPTSSTFTNNEAPVIHANDFAKLIGVFTLGAPDSGMGVHTIWELQNIGRAVAAVTSNLYGVLICTGTPTLGSVSDISVTVNTLTDAG
ncbi:hypothetical protein ABI_15480 [Asticcacaulis biprosthecium C19]|uniref:Uncharacterized protein n=1 Tax=Asticcacaulis biprosthecium C19 TaxID=715226 RepID=F4QJC5_9CAUL|nr:hypothetical protein [Asticcacaulis biprosthecium]EGF93108.1 hypothetical protein ABI_15480 [Asticcacaulis biprosthecium C19]